MRPVLVILSVVTFAVTRWLRRRKKAAEEGPVAASAEAPVSPPVPDSGGLHGYAPSHRRTE
ncbi:hypothetical protein K378_03991 [Streptomyces sp. Amel2xB2]|nr:hypothetical protein K378_03991 [Streptomyces sp. Amel2xB2]